MGFVQEGQSYYVRQDHHGLAHEIVDENNITQWQASFDSFGNVTSQPIGAITYNQRFPGQYADVESGLYYNYYRDYDPQAARYLQSDPIGLAGGLNTFGYAYQNPIMNIDPDGLEVRVYSSDAWGISGLNHSYVYSTETGRGRGANGSSGYTLGDGVGGLKNPYNVAQLPSGMTEEQFMDRIEAADNWNNGLYFPFVNDCHNDLERAFDHAGVDYPGAPNGRFDADDIIRDYLRNQLDQLRNLLNSNP